MRQRKKFIIGSIVLLIIVGYLFWSGMRDTTVYFVTVSEFLEKGDSFNERGVRVKGVVVPGSVHWDARKLLLNFQLANDGKAISVTHNGVAPDMFGENQSVIVEGKYVDNQFQATTIMTKCPSKYESRKQP